MATKTAAKKVVKPNPHTKRKPKVDGMDKDGMGKMNKLTPHNGPPGVGDRADIKADAPAPATPKKGAKRPATKLSADERLNRLERAFGLLKTKLRATGVHVEDLDDLE